jgi:hypothetical protein
MRTHGSSILALAAVGACIATPALAEEFTFSYFGALINGTGSLVGDDNGNGSFDITSGELYLTESLTGPLQLFLNPNGQSGAYSPSGFFIYDNQLYPDGEDKLTSPGLLFVAGNTEVNIFREGAAASYTFYSHGPGGDIVDHGSFEVEGVRTGGLGEPEVPAPGAAALVCVSFAAVARRRRAA